MNVRAGPRMGQVRRPDACRRTSCKTSSTACRSPQAASAGCRRRASRCRPSCRSPSSRRCRRRPASARSSTRSAAATATSPSASSPPRRTSPSRPISGRGSTAAACSRARRWPTPSRASSIPSTFNWEFSPKGQHIELGIAEMNLFILLSALGLSHSINGERLLPIGTLYDPFIARGLDALNYACYQDARFMVVATPSGITLRRRRRRASVDRRAADRPGAGRARQLRAGLCR